MKVTIELDARDFRNTAWSGARDTCDDLTDEEIQMILDNLEDAYADSESEMTLTELNDFFWFEREIIAESLGYESYEELMNRDEEGEETW